jgi:hypothetical protein
VQARTPAPTENEEAAVSSQDPYRPDPDVPAPGGSPYPYGAPTPPYAPVAAPTDDKAVWALVTAIGGFFVCPIVLHVVGWVLANQSLATIRASAGAVGGEGLAKAARILSIVGLVFYGVLILLGVLLLVLGLVAVTSTGELTTSVGVLDT